MKSRRYHILSDLVIVIVSVSWLCAVVALGVLGAQLGNGWLTLAAVVLLFGGLLVVSGLRNSS